MAINREGGYADTPRGYRPQPRPPPSIIPRQAPGGGVEDIGSDDGLPARVQHARAAGKANPQEDAILKLLQQFYDEFNSPLDFNDPYIKNILDNAQATTMQSAGNAGVFGPYSQNLAQQAYIKASTGLQDSRQNRAQQALAMLTDYKKDKRNFDYQKAQDAYTSAQDKWKWDQQHNGDLWRGIGGGLGAIGGALPGILTLNPALAVAGGSAGFGVGQQIGGGAYQAFGGGSPPPSFNPPSYRGGGN